MFKPHTLALATLLLLIVAGCTTPLPQRTEPNPDLVIGQNATTACTDLCIERQMCRELPNENGVPQPIIHTRIEPSGHGFALKYLDVGAVVRLHEVRVNETADEQDFLYGDTMYLVSSPNWDPVDRYWVPVYCLSPEAAAE